MSRSKIFAELASQDVSKTELDQLDTTLGTPSATTFLRGDKQWAAAGSTDAGDLTSGALGSSVTGGSGLTLLKLARNEGLVVKYVSATTVDIDADYLTVFDSSNVGTVLSSINLTANITASGVNGLDTGSEAAVWYHIWVIYNGTITASLLSASSTAPTMPSGYTYKKYVGAVYNPSSSFRDFHQIGNVVSVPSNDVGGTITNTTYASLSLAAVIPPTASQTSGVINATHSSSTGYFYLAANSGGLGQIHVRGSMNGAIAVPFISPVLATPSTIYKKISAGNSYLKISGYMFPNIV